MKQVKIHISTKIALSCIGVLCLTALAVNVVPLWNETARDRGGTQGDEVPPGGSPQADEDTQGTAMSIKSRWAMRHRRPDWTGKDRILSPGDHTMHDTDKPNGATPPPGPSEFVVSPISFTHPPGFEIGAFLCVAIDKQGKPFTNCPPDPALALHLANILITYATKQAIQAIETAKGNTSPILAPPPGLSITMWRGPAGRG